MLDSTDVTQQINRGVKHEAKSFNGSNNQVLYTPVKKKTKKTLMVEMADILGGANCSVFTTAAEMSSQGRSYNVRGS